MSIHMFIIMILDFSRCSPRFCVKISSFITVALHRQLFFFLTQKAALQTGSVEFERDGQEKGRKMCTTKK